MAKAKAKHGTVHELFVVAIWVVGIIIAIRLLPTLIADLSNMVAMVTGGISAVNVSPGATSSTGTSGAASSSSLPPAYSSQPNSGSVSSNTSSGSSSPGTSTAAASTGSAVTAGRYLAPPLYWGAQPRLSAPLFGLQGVQL